MFRHFLILWAGLLPLAGLAQPAARLDQLTEKAKQLLIRQQPDSAWQYAIRPGLSLLRQLPDTALAGRQFRTQTVAYQRERHQFMEAIGSGKILIQLCQQANDRAAEGQTRQSLVVTYADLGMYQECISELLRNLTLFQQPQNLEMLAKTYNYLAWAYQQQENETQWEHYTRLAIRYGKLTNKPLPRTVAFLNEGNLYVQKKQFGKAVQTFRAILPEIEANPTLHNYLADGYRCLAEGLQQAGQSTEALRVANAGLAKCRQYGNKMAEISDYLTIVNIHASLHNNEASLTAATQALSLSAKDVPPIARQAALKAVSAAQERVGNYAAALTATRQWADLTDSLNRINRAEAIAAAEARFGVQTKNATIGLLNKNIILRQEQTRQQQQTASIIIGLLVLGVVVVGLFWYRARQRGQLLAHQKLAIENQARQLAALNEVKDKLFSTVSHDLRAPVTSLLQSIDRLETASLNTIAEALPRFRQAVSVVVTLTENLLYWSLAQMNGLQTDPRPVDIRDALANTLQLVEEPLRQKKMTVQLPAGESMFATDSILADENLVEIVLRNVIQNALTFSPVGGRLTFSTERDERWLTLLVSDEGPGFFWQPGNPKTGKPQTRPSQSGTGLGLLVVEELMHLNGGRVQISPRPDRSGTVVRLIWPMAEVVLPVHANGVA